MSFRSVLTVSTFAAAMLAASLSSAQQGPPNPLDAIPDKMPFDIPVGIAISLEHAQAAIAAAIAEAKKHGWKMNVAVVGPSGDLVAFAAMDGAQLASVSIAQHKARTAARYRRETKIFENLLQGQSLRYLVTLDDVIASRGGIPLVQDGKLIGAIGCSGGTGSQDEASCKPGAATVK